METVETHTYDPLIFAAEMGLVKYIEKRGLGTVKSTSHFHVEHDGNSFVDQTQGVCVQLENHGDVKTRGDVNIPLEESETTRLKKRKNGEPKRSARKLDNNIVFSECSESSNETEDGESDLVALDRLGCLVPKLVTRFKKKVKREALLHDRISRYRLRMSLQNEKIVKMVRKLKDPNTSALAKRREAIRMVAKNSSEHAKVVKALKKKLAKGEVCD